MSLRGIRSRIAAIGREMPALESNTSGPARNAQRLAQIAAAPDDDWRDLLVMATVIHAAQVEEPEDYAALVAAIGAEAIERAFPDGVPTQPPAAVRACARAYQREHANEVPTVDPITTMVQAMISQEKP